MKLVIVGGIHGAGKSSLCRRLAPELGAEWVSAGAALRSVMGTQQRQEKIVADVEGNQEAIARALASTLGGIEKPVLLDGHFVLWKGSNHVEKVPVDYFRALRPVALLIVDTPVGDIKFRLKIRDSKEYSKKELDNFRRAEISHGRAVSQVLSIPLQILPGSDAIETAREFLATLLAAEPPPLGSAAPTG